MCSPSFAATCIPYALGTLWLSYSTKMSISAALAAGVLPFVLVDLIKMVAVALVGPELRERLDRAGIISYAK